jgi:excisionase family DNA binding protein
MSDLRSLFAPDVVVALERLVDERVAEALAARDREPAKRWLSPREAGEYLACSERAVYARIRRGRISAGAVRHSGRSVLIDRLALDRQLERSG